MNSSFTITNCTYDGTSGDPNPICTVEGTVKGNSVYAAAFFEYLAAADQSGQMQAALTALMFNWYAAVYRSQLAPWPTPIPLPQFPVSDAVAEHTQGPYPQPLVVYTPALIGSWI
jgi:hypothetical protein